MPNLLPAMLARSRYSPSGLVHLREYESFTVTVAMIHCPPSAGTAPTGRWQGQRFTKAKVMHGSLKVVIFGYGEKPIPVIEFILSQEAEIA